jgi:hypothetical protein
MTDDFSETTQAVTDDLKRELHRFEVNVLAGMREYFETLDVRLDRVEKNQSEMSRGLASLEPRIAAIEERTSRPDRSEAG